MKSRVSSFTTMLILLIFAIFPAAGETSQKTERCFLWEVRSRTSLLYLLGSVHFAPEALYPLPEEIETAFRNSDYLVVENDAEKEGGPDVSELTWQYGLRPMGSGMQEDLPPELYRKFDEALSRYGLSAGEFCHMKPWLSANILSSLYLMSSGYHPESGLDSYFLRKARGKMQIFELEPLEYQIALLSGLSEDLQQLYLRAAIDDVSRPPELLRQLIQAWQMGDLKRFTSIIYQAFQRRPGMKPIFELLYLRRNREMAEKLRTYLTREGTFFVVLGAGHIGGEGGILDLFSADGYRISQVLRKQQTDSLPVRISLRRK